MALKRKRSGPSRTATLQRRLQRQMARADRRGKGKAEAAPMQAGARRYPVPPFKKQHLRKPGLETALDPQPLYDAPFYRGSEKLQGKAAIITGGDSGIGRAVAILFAREGADIVLAYLDEHADAEVTRKAIEQEGRRCLLLAGSVGQVAFCRRVIKEAMKTFKRIDVLVNNAAFQLHARDIEELTEAHFDQTLKTNLYGYFNMAKAVIPHMRPGSAIVNTGSVTGLHGSKHLLDYSLTKGGIHAFTRSLAGHLIDRGIRVNAVAPGPVWTPLNPADKQAQDVSKFGSSVPMKRPAQPEEIAPAYVFLASSHCSSFITGEILPIIGGY